MSKNKPGGLPDNPTLDDLYRPDTVTGFARSKAETKISMQTMYNNLMNILTNDIKKIKLPSIKVDSKRPRILVANLSDTHFGKKVEHQYSFSVATKRLTTYFKEMADYADNHNISHIVVPIIGDIVHGEVGVYENQPWDIEHVVMDQLRNGSSLIWNCVQELSKNFTVELQCVRGNHGETAGAQETNWDSVVYYMLHGIIANANNPNVSIHIGNNTNEFTVFKHKVHMRHKMARVSVTGIKGGMRANNTKDALLGYIIKHSPDIILTAHWHTPGQNFVHNVSIICNGSIVPVDTYADDLGLSGKPAQVMFTVTPNHTLDEYRVVWL